MSEEIKLSKNAEKVLELVSGLTVLELSELVKAMENKFGVMANAPVTVAANPIDSGQASNSEEEKSSFDIELTSAGGQKIAVIKVIKEVTGEWLKEAKVLADNGGKVKEGVPKDEAEEIKSKLEEAGASVELK